MSLDVGPLRLLRLPEVLARVGLKRSALYEIVSRGSFPRPCRLGQRCVAWPEHEVNAWLQARLAERDAGQS